MQIISVKDFDSRFDTKELYTILTGLPKVSGDCYLCSGAIRRTILKQPLEDGDFDFFFRNEESLKNFKGLIQNIESEKDNELNISLSVKINDKSYKVQLIKLYNEKIEDLLASFDYTLCQTAFDGLNYYFGDFTIKDIIEKRIIVNKITYPISSMRRLFKYTKQGFWMCPQQIEKFLTETRNNTELNKVISVD